MAGGFLESGFDLYMTPPFGRRRPGLAAFVPPARTGLDPWPEKDRDITLKSTAGIPYRDPDLTRSRNGILEMRHAEMIRRRAEGMPKWYRKP